MLSNGVYSKSSGRMLSVPVGAFAGAILSIVLVYSLAKTAGEVAPIRLVLVGVATATRRSFAAESVLGKLRGDLWRLGQEAGVLEPFPKMRDAETPLRFLWVDAFPLFERGENGSLRSTHHPFTAPSGVATVEEIQKSDVTKLLSNSCDLVLNGNEVGGG